MSISKAMGVERAEPVKRRMSDFYPTPRECTDALLEEELPFLRRHELIWEPAVGDGAISRAVEARGLRVVSSDLVDRGAFGAIIRNFFDFESPLGSAIITNPPYGSDAPVKFVRHALDLGCSYIAMLLKVNFWNADRRLGMFTQRPLAAVYPLAFRPDFTGDGSPTMDMAWFVWDDSRSGQVFKPLPRPVPGRSDLPLFAEAAE